MYLLCTCYVLIVYLLCTCCWRFILTLFLASSCSFLGGVFCLQLNLQQVYAQLGIVQMRVGHMWQAALSLQRALFHTNGQHLMGKKKKERRQDCDGILESSTKVVLLILTLFFVLLICSFGMVCGVACVACCSTVYHSLGIFRIVARGKQSCGGGSGSVQHTAAAVGHKDHQ